MADLKIRPEQAACNQVIINDTELRLEELSRPVSDFVIFGETPMIALSLMATKAMKGRAV